MKRFFKLVSMFVLAGATLTYTGCTDYDKDIDNLGQEVDALEGRLATLEQQVKNLESLKSQLSDLETKYAGLDKKHGEDVAALEKKIKDAKEALETSLKSYMKTDDAKATFVMKDGLKQAIVDLGYFAAKTEVTEAKNLADSALSTAKTALGDVNSLKTALGVYAQAGAIQDSLNTKLSLDKFDEAFNKALTRAVTEEDGIITKAIADAIDAATAEFAAMFYGELRSLVTIPDFYVNGIESVEYNYVAYKKQTVDGNTVDTKDGEVSVKITDDLKEDVAYKTTGNVLSINPAISVKYHKNPAGAKVNESSLSFVSKDVDIYTRAEADAKPVTTNIISDKDGVLEVDLTALGEKVKMQWNEKAPEKQQATMFALQAKYKDNEGKDITVTSDYANIVASKTELVDLAFADKDYKGETVAHDGTTLKNAHVWKTAKLALENEPSFSVAWDGNVEDLSKCFEIHYVAKPMAGDSKVMVMTAETMEKYGLTYEFSMVDYFAGTNKTSDSKFATINGAVLDPCATTDGESEADKNDRSSIGKRPLFRVLVKNGNDILLAGFVKVEIGETVVPVKPFESATFEAGEFQFVCGSEFEYTSTWDQIIDKIIEQTELSQIEFLENYKLVLRNPSTPESKKLAQFVKTGENTYKALDREDYYGIVDRIDETTASGTTTNVFRWTMEDKDLSRIYDMEGHTLTIYVKYEMTVGATKAKYESIYVPISVVVTKPAGATGVVTKISAYWFDGTSAKSEAVINVNHPKKNSSTHPWITDLNQVWVSGAPTIQGVAAPYKVADFAAQNGTNGGYRYYFAPVQPEVVASNGKTYTLYVKETKVTDLYTGLTYPAKAIAANSEIAGLEAEHSINVNAGIYTNVNLYACVKDEPNTEQLVASINQGSGNIQVAESGTAKLLVNAPSESRGGAAFYANIGIAAYTSCGTVYSVANSIFPYHFLKPINIKADKKVEFIDAADDHSPATNVNIYDMLTFTDWRNQAFVGEDGNLDNLWYFGFYEINGIAVDIANVTTNLNGGDINSTKLTGVAPEIQLSYHKGTFLNPSAPIKGVNNFTYLAPVQPGWSEAQLNGVKNYLGFIHYENNGSTVSGDFQVCVPVEVYYYWGSIKTNVYITIQPSLGA